MSGTSFWGGRGGFAPLILKNSDFLVFLPTKFCIFHILPPPPLSKSVKILPPPRKKLK